ncbi:MAG: hypothetical protein PHW52_01455 [Candidatus Pacebacteria bacterium]|nr:hypothetical protein [Candidatus Paceibacterota bacterium]
MFVESINDFIDSIIIGMKAKKLSLCGLVLKKKALARMEADFKKDFKAFQKRCSHRLEEVHELDRDYSNGFKGESKSIIKGWRCHRCGIFIPRKKGKPWEVCHMCGSESMRTWIYRTNPREQTRSGIVYRCTDCGHEYVMQINDSYCKE